MEQPVVHTSTHATVADFFLNRRKLKGKLRTMKRSTVIKQTVMADTSLDSTDKKPATLQAKLCLQALSSHRYINPVLLFAVNMKLRDMRI